MQFAREHRVHNFPLGTALIAGLSLITAAHLLTGTARAQATKPTQNFVAVSSQEGVTLLEGIRPVLTFQQSVQSQNGRWPRANYVHPIYDLQGRVLTEDFPVDHGHHRGVFWAWHQVLVSGQPIGDAWQCKDFTWHVEHVTPSTEGSRAVLHSTALWSSPVLLDEQGTEIPIAREQVVITVHSTREDYRQIDFEIMIQALVEDLRIGGSDDEKGYGGFSPRIELNPDQVFRSAQGILEPAKLAIQAGPWVDISDEQRGISIFSDPDNPGHPEPWILRRARSMQNAAYPGRNPVAVSKDAPLRLRYGLVVHDGSLTKERIEELYAAFSSRQ